MGIFNNEIIINNVNPFENDKLNREHESDNLTSLFNLVDNQMVLAIDSPWGTGKSSFLKMWNQKLKNNGYDTVFFNAWENDFVEDAFIAFVDEIRESLERKDRKVDKLIKNAKELGALMVKNSPKMLASFFEHKIGVDIGDMVPVDDISNLIGDKINEYRDTKNSIIKFKNELKNIAQETINNTEKPIIIFVDELDRCRPDFAIRLLERIKHLFSVENIIFVLGIDKYALSNSIKVVYGESTEINGYLARFIDMEYKLNDISTKQYIEYLSQKLKFTEIFVKRRKLNPYVSSPEFDYREFLNILNVLFVELRLSLREIEKILGEIYFILKSNEAKFIYPYALILLCIIKRVDKRIYRKIKFKQINFNQLIDELNIKFNWFKEWIEKYDNAVYKANLLWILDDKNELDRLESLNSSVDDKDRFKNSKIRCIQSYKYITTNYERSFLDEKAMRKLLFSKIDFYENILS